MYGAILPLPHMQNSELVYNFFEILTSSKNSVFFKISWEFNYYIN
jgi:hypothetical protein